MTHLCYNQEVPIPYKNECIKFDLTSVKNGTG